MLRKAPVSYLVVNGDESEPATFKDHFLVERDPHQLVEGVIIAAYALQVSQAFIYLRGEFALGLERVQQAVNDAYSEGALGSKIFGSDFSIDLVVHPGAGAYICGEETALIEGLEGKRGFPRIKPPFFPAVTGLYGEPTVVNNVETMSNLPWIVNNGGAAFAALGVGRSTGTRLFALAGRVNNPGVYEIEMVKNTFRDLIYDPALAGVSLAAAPSRRSSPVGSRRPGSVRTCWTYRWSRRSGREGFDAGLGFGRGLRRDELCRASGVADHQILLARVVRPVHAVSRGLGLDRARDVPPRARRWSHGRYGPPA